jgi:pentatricopeptide repeat protein
MALALTAALCGAASLVVQVFGSIVEAAAVAGKPSVAAEMLKRMKTAGIPPNVIAYTSLVSSYGASGDVEGAKLVLQQMEAAGCPPNGKTYTELMAQLAAKGKYAGVHVTPACCWPVAPVHC